MARSRRQKRRCGQMNLFRPRVERLEERQLMAANLRVSSIDFIDPFGRIIPAPIVGEEFRLQLSWQSDDLTASNTYQVQGLFDGVSQTSFRVANPGQAVAESTIVGPWFATAGQHRLELILDSGQVIAETNESDNRLVRGFTPLPPTTLPSKFIFPVDGQQNQDWVITNYVDVQGNNLGDFNDYRCFNYTIPGNSNIQIEFPNYSAMDAGIAVRSVASGTVVAIDGANSDRATSPGFGRNYVLIDHGNGWQTIYLNLLQDSLTVEVGDSVNAGQTLGLVGGSAFDPMPKLYFYVQHNFAVVETFLDPAAYWIKPPEYQSDTAQSVIAAGVTNAAGMLDLREHASDIQTLHPVFNAPLTSWFDIGHLTSFDLIQVIWVTPDGSTIAGGPRRAPRKDNLDNPCVPEIPAYNPIRNYIFTESLDVPWSQYVGLWHATLQINGREVARVPFEIDPEPLVPELLVTQVNSSTGATEIIVDERTTPIDFGQVAVGGLTTSQSFAIVNHGTGVMHLSNLQLPSGFSLVGNSFPSLINPGDSATLSLQLDSSIPGLKFGQLRFITDDPSESVMNFNIKGNVIGSLTPGTPTITLNGPAASYVFQQSPVLLSRSVDVLDSDSSFFSGGSLKFEIVSGASSGDVLSIRNVGFGTGQVGVFGNSVTISGVNVATFSGGTNGQPLVISFGPTVTLAMVQAIASSIEFSNSLAIPATNPRYIRPTITDSTGLSSTGNVKMVVVTPNTENQLPVSTTLFADVATVVEPGRVKLTAMGVADSDGSVRQVEFYLESNGLNGLQTGAGGDTLIRQDFVESDGWTADWSSVGVAGGNRILYAQAVDDRLGRSIAASTTVQVVPQNDPPTIVFMNATPSQVVQPASTTLQAHGVLDTDGLVRRVDFFMETNSIAGFQSGSGGDSLIGSDLSGEGGWTLSYSTAGMLDGRYAFYAQAVDDRGGTTTTPVSTSVDVGVPAPPGSVYDLADLLPTNGGDGSKGFVVDGNAALENAGFSVSSAGDINGDGFADVVIGAPSANPGNPSRFAAGEAYVVFGNANGPTNSVAPGSLTGVNGFRIQGNAAGDNLGFSVAAVGDVNGDGFDDLLIGAPGVDRSSAANAGAAYLIFGRSSGFTASMNVASLTTDGVAFLGERFGDGVGTHVASGGDLNGDGLADLVISAPRAEPSGAGSRTDAGVSYVVFGKNGTWPNVFELNTLTGANGFRVGGSNAGDLLGTWAGSIGDINGDGISDLGFGAPGATPFGLIQNVAAGQAYVLFGKGTSFDVDIDLLTMASSQGFQLDGARAGDRAGASLAALGDVNGDGFADIAISADKADPSGSDSGEVYVIYGRAGSFASVLPLASVDGVVGSRITGVSANQRTGYRVGAAGDVNGDGFKDLVIGNFRVDLNSTNRSAGGAAYVVLGRSLGLGASMALSSLNGSNGFRIEGSIAGGNAGRAVAGAGDVNGDGLADLIVGAPDANLGTGQAFVFYGRDFTRAITGLGDQVGNELTGSSGRDVLVGGVGSDSLIGNGGADVLQGGSGDDILAISNGAFFVLDGGSGTDTLRFDGQVGTIDLTTLPDGRIANIEKIDITGGGNNTLRLSYRDVLNLSESSNTVTIERNDGDVLDLGTGWVITSQSIVNGVVYNVLSQSGATVVARAVKEGTPWQNPAMSVDVDNDRVLAPSDALLIINYLNSNKNQNSALPNPPIAPFAPAPLGSAFYYDVSGDGFVSAIDALLVINSLNSRIQASGEGEASAISAGVVDVTDKIQAGPGEEAAIIQFERLLEPSTVTAVQIVTAPGLSAAIAKDQANLVLAVAARSESKSNRTVLPNVDLESAISLIASDILSRRP